ncbi:hypothetical protein O3M35_006539 [Rhynocoris fuscipes]|uniref:Zinc finger protein 865 n=1 Tax=Rhynocoris fuscipes TaxID=488301 RepID=A0AAW1DFI2_9HEMI
MYSLFKYVFFCLLSEHFFSRIFINGYLKMRPKKVKCSEVKTTENNNTNKNSKLTKSLKRNSKTTVKRSSRASNVDKKSVKSKSPDEELTSNGLDMKDFVNEISKNDQNSVDETNVYNIENTNHCSSKENDSSLGDKNGENISIKNGDNEDENNKNETDFKCPDCQRSFKSCAALRKHELSCYDFNKTTEDINKLIASLKASGAANNLRAQAMECDIKSDTVSESITLTNESEIDKGVESSISETVSSLTPDSIPSSNNFTDLSNKTVTDDNEEGKNQNSKNLNATYKCLYCKKVFKTAKGYRKHEVICKRKPFNGADKISLDDNQEINYELKSPSETESNFPDIDGDVNNGECHEDISEKVIGTLKKKKEFRCHECGKLYHSSLRLQKHIRVVHHNECLLCGDKFPDNHILLKRHMLLIHPKNTSTITECHICEEKFPDEYSVNTHLLIHSGIEPPIIECHLCGIRCVGKKYHDKHMLIHSGCTRSESDSNCGSDIIDGKETINENIFSNEDKENEVERISDVTSPHPLDNTIRDGNVSEGITDDSCVKDGEESSNGNKYECHECGKSYLVKSSLERHIRVLHSYGNSLQCPQCEAKFPDKGALARHMYTHTGLKPYSCPVCKQEFSRKYHLVRHNLQTGCDGRERAAYPCQVCGREFTRKDNLREHLRAHAGQTKRKKKYICESCEMEYETIEELKLHRKDHIGEKEYTCEYCPKKCLTSAALKKHRRTHTGEKPFECSSCDKKFAAKETLNRHIKIHTGYKPHTCQYCDKSFIQSTQLRNHLVCHTGIGVFQPIRIFVCDLCGKKFNRKPRLNEHVKFFHLGAKPYECVHCIKTFIRKEDLNRHLVIHSGVKAHQCPICTKSFTMKSTLKVHLLTHTKEPPRSCDACGRAFIRQDCLLRHMKTRHREMLEEIKCEAEKKKLQQQLLQVAAEASLVEGMEERKELDENGLIDAVRELLTLLVDETTLRDLGWPDAGVEALLEAVIKRCGHDPEPSTTPRHDRLRHNIKLLFTVVIDDSAVKALLNNQTVDEVILHVLRLAKS